LASSTRRLADERLACAEDGLLVDLAVRGAAADPQLVVGLHDSVESGHVADVDEQGGLSQSQLQEGDQAVAAGEDLRVALALREDLEGPVEVRRTDIVEGCGNHARPSSSTPGAGAITAHLNVTGVEL